MRLLLGFSTLVALIPATSIRRATTTLLAFSRTCPTLSRTAERAHHPSELPQPLIQLAPPSFTPLHHSLYRSRRFRIRISTLAASNECNQFQPNTALRGPRIKDGSRGCQRDSTCDAQWQFNRTHRCRHQNDRWTDRRPQTKELQSLRAASAVFDALSHRGSSAFLQEEGWLR